MEEDRVGRRSFDQESESENVEGGCRIDCRVSWNRSASTKNLCTDVVPFRLTDVDGFSLEHPSSMPLQIVRFSLYLILPHSISTNLLSVVDSGSYDPVPSHLQTSRRSRSVETICTDSETREGESSTRSRSKGRSNPACECCQNSHLSACTALM